MGDQGRDRPRDQAPRWTALFADPELVELLSRLGVHATHYGEGLFFPERPLPGGGRIEPRQAWQDFLETLHPRDRERISQAARAIYTGESRSFEETFRIRNPDDTYRWVVSKGEALGTIEAPGTTETPDTAGADAPLLYVGIETDITAHKELEEALQQKNRELLVLREAAAVIGASLSIHDTVQRILEQTRKIIPCQTAAVQMFQDTQLEVIGCAGFRDPEKVLGLRFPFPEAGSLSTRAIQEQRPFISLDVTTDFPAFIQPPGEERIQSWMGIPLIRHGSAIGLVSADHRERGVYTDHHVELAAILADHIAIALENARLHEKTYTMAMTDALTGLANRHRLLIEGRLLLETAARSGQPLAVAMIDVDHFKAVNDRYGHDQGDRVLQAIAACCTEQLRSSDVLARYGGEEFVLLFPGTRPATARIACERIRQHISNLHVPGLDEAVSVSIGVSGGIPRRGEDLNSFITRADRAMYRAKEAGRNRVDLA